MGFTALIAAALTAAALIGAVQNLLRTAGFGPNGALVVEQRRQAQALETIEFSIARIQADVAMLNARVGETENLYREAVSAAPAGPALAHPVHSNGPEFELAALRASFDGNAEFVRVRTVNGRLDARRHLARRPRAQHAERGAALARTAPSA